MTEHSRDLLPLIKYKNEENETTCANGDSNFLVYDRKGKFIKRFCALTDVEAMNKLHDTPGTMRVEGAFRASPVPLMGRLPVRDAKKISSSTTTQTQTQTAAGSAKTATETCSNKVAPAQNAQTQLKTAVKKTPAGHTQGGASCKGVNMKQGDAQAQRAVAKGPQGQSAGGTRGQK